ncbi:MAG: aspartate/glutamate racemase family protein [Desulfitobacterium hafniense]|nr:aspartate/glutamate racemase family protein [Desulfitobacterium hafniense]
MKIKVIVPLIGTSFNDEVCREVASLATPGVEYDVESLDYGPASIESEYDEAIAVPDILNKVRKAEEEGFDGAILDCFGDPGVRAAREITNIVVFGGFEPPMLIASGLGDKIAIVTVLPEVIPMIEGLIAKAGLKDRVVAVRHVNIPVLELTDIQKLKDALFEQSVEAIKQNGAQVIVLGCTGMMGVANEVMDRLKEAGYDIPVVDAFAAALRMTEAVVSLGLRPSKLTYMPVRMKDRKWWGE